MKSLVGSLRVLSSWSFLAGVSLFAGCTTLGISNESKLAGSPAVGQATPTPGQVAGVTLEVHNGSKKPTLRQLPLQNEMRVQEALEAGGLLKRSGGLKIKMIRMEGDQPAKLDIKFDRKHRMVEPLYDYALRPGDHLIVSEDKTSTLEEMARNSALGRAVGTGTKK